MISLLRRSRPGRLRTAQGYLGGMGAAAQNADVETCVWCLFWFGSVCMRVYVVAVGLWFWSVVSAAGVRCQSVCPGVVSVSGVACLPALCHLLQSMYMHRPWKYA